MNGIKIVRLMFMLPVRDINKKPQKLLLSLATKLSQNCKPFFVVCNRLTSNRLSVCPIVEKLFISDFIGYLFNFC